MMRNSFPSPGKLNPVYGISSDSERSGKDQSINPTDMSTVVCKLCKKMYANIGSIFAFPTHIIFSEIESEILPNIEQSLTVTGM